MFSPLALVLASTLAVVSPCAEAFCRCAPQAPVAAALEQAEAVFSGVVLAVSGERNPAQPERWPVEVTLQVTRRWKGPAADTLVVRTGEGGGDCGFPFQVGAEYLVYASGQDVLYTGICHRTRLVLTAEEDLRVLGPPLHSVPQRKEGNVPA